MDFKAILEYSPYDNKRISPFEVKNDKRLEVDSFNETFFVPYPPATETLERKLCSEIEGTTNNIIFYGASGSGKTTFLNYFVKKYRNQYDFHFFNLIDEPSPMEYDQCIRSVLLSKLYSLLDDDKNNVAMCLHDRVVVQKSLMPFDRKEDNDMLIEYLGVNYLEKCDAEDVIGGIGLNEGKIGPNSNRSLLVLCIIAELLAADNGLSKKNKNVFVFDNLDEIPTQYIVSDTYQLIFSAFSIVQKYCQKYSGYNFLRDTTFILSYRSTNAQIVDRSQHEDRMVLSTENIEFRNEYQVSYTDIFNKRADYYWSKNTDLDEKDGSRLVWKLLNSEKNYCRNVLRPFFNYDFRMLTHFFVLHMLEKGLDGVDEALIKEQTQERKKKKEEQTGARGILLFNAMEAMMKDPSSRIVAYMRHEFEMNSLCNIYRMSFTLLSNMGGWSLQRDAELVNALREENDFNDETPRIGFYDFLKRIEKWYGKDLVKIVIDGLIGSVAYNYEYPIALLGGPVDDFFKDSSTKHTPSGLAKYIEEAYSQNDSVLSNVYVKINPLCVIYAWRVFINFEYFNLISNQWENPSVKDYKYDPIPLFQINNEHVLTGCLNSVFSTVNLVLGNADKHFCEKCPRRGGGKCKYDKDRKQQTRTEVESDIETCKENFQSFVQDGFCINGTLYATRVITSHLNYLDKYKTYVWEKFKDDPEKSHEMQSLILKQMDKYIDMWGKRRVVDEDKLLRQYQDKLKTAFAKLEDDKECYSISISDED